MPQLELSFLGAFQVAQNGQPVPHFRVNTARALLAYLAVEADRPHRRETLAGLLWPDVPDVNALNHLRHTLSDLRKAIGDDDHTAFLHITRSTLQFNLDRSTRLDVAAFQRAAQSNTLNDLEEAAALYRGPFLAGFSLEGSPAFEEWLLVRQQQLAQRAVDVLYRAASQRAERGDYGLAQDHAQRLLTIEPWHEAALLLLIRSLALEGRRNEALAQYETYRHALARDFNAQPSAELAAESDRLRAGRWVISIPTESLAPAAAVPLFVARERELTRLDRALALARSGQGQIMFVAGEAGSGKTALLNEFVRRTLKAHGAVIPAAGLCSAQLGPGDPYLPFRDILSLLTGDIEAKRASGSLAPDHARRLWEALPDTLQAIVEHGPDLIGSFVNAETLLLCAEALTPAHTLWRTRLIELARRPLSTPPAHIWRQITAVLSTIALSRPLLLIVDDAQWADDETLGLLFHLGRLLPAGLLIVCAYRPDDVALGRAGQRHPLESVINEVQRMTGEAAINLDAAEGRAFIDALLDATLNRLDDQFRATLYQHTSGHALFAVELISDLKVRGELVRDAEGYWTAGNTLDWQHLPARVEAVIAEHIGRVPDQWQALLQAACVAGGEFSAEVVAEAIGWAESDVVRTLSGDLSQQYHLVVATRVDRIGVQRGPRYRFRHALFETYLYQQLDAVTRLQWHEAIGTALEKRFADRPGELPEIALQLMRHFEGAGLKMKAARYGLIAAQRATRLSAYQEASRLLTHAVTLLADVPDSLERARLETNVQLALGAVLLEQGWGTSDRARAFDRALELARRSSATTDLLLALHSLVDLAQGRGEAAKAVALSHELLRLAERNGQASLLALAHYSLGSSRFIIGNLSQARDQLTQAVALNDGTVYLSTGPHTGADITIGALAWLISVAWLMGDRAAAEEHIAQVLERAGQIKHMFSLGIALVIGVCPYWLSQGAVAQDRTRGYIDQLAQLAQGGVPMFRVWAKIFDGYWLARRGEANGLAQLQQGIAEWTATGSRGGYVYQRLLLIEVCLVAGENIVAQRAIAEAHAFIEQSGYRAYEAELHRLRGELAAARDDHAEADACFRQALDVANGQGASLWAERAARSLKSLVG